jgi:hypothetical protein
MLKIISRFITDLEILHFPALPTQPAPSATSATAF